MKVVFLFVLFLIPFGILRGESEIRIRGLENRVESLEKDKVRPKYPMTSCAGPNVHGGMDINLSADFIYWTARLDTLTYAKTGFGTLNDPISGPTSVQKKGDVQMVDWTWDPGFKVGMGWSFPHGCWDMRLQYTWFYTNVGDSKESDTLQPGFEVLTAADRLFSILSFDKAQAHFDLHYQLGDLELGRNYYVSKTLKLRPFIGMKGTWQKQDYNVFYDSVSLSINDTVYNFRTHFGHAIWGIGMRGGLNTSWQFANYIGLYGDIALSGLWVHYDTDRKDVFTEIVQGQQDGNPFTTVNTQDHLRLIKPVLELGMGLRLETYFSNKRFHILLQAGWETHIWLNQTLYISINDNYDRFDLTLQGLTAKLRFDF